MQKVRKLSKSGTLWSNNTSGYDSCSLFRLPSEWGEEDEWRELVV